MRIPTLSLLLLFAASAGSAACGAKSATEPDAPSVATSPIYYAMLVGMPNNGPAGTVVATVDVPVGMTALASSPTAAVPVLGAKLTLTNGTVIPLSGSYDLNTHKVTLTSADNFYRIVLDLIKSKQNPDGTYTTADGRVGGISITATPAPASPLLFCGTFSGDAKGWVNVQTLADGLGNGSLQGTADDGEGIITFRGTVTSNDVKWSFAWSDGKGSTSGSGTILGGSSMSGLWSNTDGEKGLWSVQTNGCR